MPGLPLRLLSAVVLGLCVVSACASAAESRGVSTKAACDLLTASELGAALGRPVLDGSSPDGDRTDCDWSTQTQVHSVLPQPVVPIEPGKSHDDPTFPGTGVSLVTSDVDFSTLHDLLKHPSGGQKATRVPGVGDEAIMTSSDETLYGTFVALRNLYIRVGSVQLAIQVVIPGESGDKIAMAERELGIHAVNNLS